MNTKKKIYFENLAGIYRIISPSGRVYIGQSVNIRERVLSYYRLECIGQIRLYNSFLKYGISNHVFMLVEYCSIECLNERERYWQDYYNVLGKKGLNCRLTKNNDKSGNLSKDTIDKAIKTRKEKNSACKTVFQYNKEGELVNTFISTKECSEKLNINRSSVIGCASINSKLMTYKGFVFSYINLHKKEVLKKYNKTRKKGITFSNETKAKMSKIKLKYKIKSIDLNSMEELYFKNIHEVVLHFNFKKSSIYQCCLGHRKSLYNIKFEYYE